MQTCYIAETVTGTVLAQVTPFKYSWNRVLNGAGGGNADFRISAVGPNLNWNDLLTPWSRTFVVCEEGVVIYAGLCISRDDDIGSNTISLKHQDIRVLLDRRSTFGTNGYSGGTPDNKLELVNITADRLAAWVLWAGTEAPALANPSFRLPIIPIAKGTTTGGGTESETYFDYQSTVVGSAMTEAQNRDRGPDIDFLPQWGPTHKLEYRMRAGTASNPQLTGALLEFNLATSNHGLVDVKRTVDGKNQATYIYAVGEGTEADMKVKTAKNESFAPALEKFVQYKKIGDETVLQSHADADLKTYSSPVEQWSYRLQLDSIQYQPLGTLHKLWFEGSPIIETGWHTLRVIGWSGDETRWVTPVLQPIGSE
ncbi:hypothetical protein B7R22_05320 [Subtercola boreus]|uniref:Minor tail protein n=1 Tax=Subtercola boreus TaxID=120213 RepID=A0A3E0W2N1_9MICO|nr:hypothetical protein [Subtercola boreus]RFA15828.1 hypothetical protein B7R22_05320 [Subtercola boreus]